MSLLLTPAPSWPQNPLSPSSPDPLDPPSGNDLTRSPLRPPSPLKPGKPSSPWVRESVDVRGQGSREGTQRESRYWGSPQPRVPSFFLPSLLSPPGSHGCQRYPEKQKQISSPSPAYEGLSNSVPCPQPARTVPKGYRTGVEGDSLRGNDLPPKPC